MKVAVVCPSRNTALDVVKGLAKDTNTRHSVSLTECSLTAKSDNGDEIIWVNKLSKALGRKFDMAFIQDVGCYSIQYYDLMWDMMIRSHGNFECFVDVEELFM